MARSKELSPALLELSRVESVLVLNNTSTTLCFCEVPYMGVWSVRSGNVYRYADGSVTVWEPRLQTWIVRPARHHGHVRADTEIMLRLIRPHHPP
jgi:hypothetical protein